MIKLNKILAVIFSIVTILFAIYLKDIKVLSFLIFIVVLFILKMNSSLKFLGLIYGFLGIFLGFLLHLYKFTTWYDTFIHFISGIVISIIAIYILNLFKLFINKNVLFNIIYMILFVLAISAFWEVCEFVMDNIFNSDMQRLATGVNDTMKDIISAFLGSLLFNISFYYEYKNNKKLLVQKIIRSITGGSYGR